MLDLDQIYCGDCVDVMKKIDDESIDLTVTSPPYDNLRTYRGYSFDFESIALELFRITKKGGVVVWVVADATIKGSETGTSFKQALFFKEIGFNIHDTMIWDKGGFSAVGTLVARYASVFEYMFILSKGKLKSFNPIKDKLNKYGGSKLHGTIVQKDGTKTRITGHNKKIISEYGQRHNIWSIAPCKQRKIKHSARFPEALAHDHIISWSNPGNLVLDPMCGSGTTCKMAKETNRKYIGIDCSEEYCRISRKRL